MKNESAHPENQQSDKTTSNINAARQLQQTIRHAIPLSQHMGYTIVALSETHIQVTAPLENNVNIHGTAFAGSIYSVATLTAWALGYHILQSTETKADLVLGEGKVKYRAPIKTDLQCSATITAEEHTAFLNTPTETDRSRLLVQVNINDGAAYWEGKLTAIRPAAKFL